MAAGQPGVDGRTARRDRNSEAVLDAVRELFVEGTYTPTAEAVAARSEVSLRSVYRYFEHTDALLRAAVARSVVVEGPLFVLPDIGVGTRDERIARLVDHRLALYEALAPEARASIARAPQVPLIAEQLAYRRSQLGQQVHKHFAQEARAIAGPAGKALLSCIDALLQFEAVDHLRTHGGLSRTRARRVLVTGLTALLEAAGS